MVFRAGESVFSEEAKGGHFCQSLLVPIRSYDNTIKLLLYKLAGPFLFFQEAVFVSSKVIKEQLYWLTR